MSFVDKLKARGACTPAVEWCRTQPDFTTAWKCCIEPSWMMWHLAYNGYNLRRLIDRLFEITDKFEQGSDDWDDATSMADDVNDSLSEDEEELNRANTASDLMGMMFRSAKVEACSMIRSHYPEIEL